MRMIADDPAIILMKVVETGRVRITDKVDYAVRAAVQLAAAEGAGPVKADAIAAVVEGPVTAMVPGSVLQLHRFATVIVDEAAASKLTHDEYYRWTFDRKPEWQRYRKGL